MHSIEKPLEIAICNNYLQIVFAQADEKTQEEEEEKVGEAEEEGNWNICNIMKINDPITHSFSYLPTFLLHKTCIAWMAKEESEQTEEWTGGRVVACVKGTARITFMN